LNETLDLFLVGSYYHPIFRTEMEIHTGAYGVLINS